MQPLFAVLLGLGCLLDPMALRSELHLLLARTVHLCSTVMRSTLAALQPYVVQLRVCLWVPVGAKCQAVHAQGHSTAHSHRHKQPVQRVQGAVQASAGSYPWTCQ